MEKAQKKLAEFWKDPVICPVCKTAEWVLGPSVADLFNSDLKRDVAMAEQDQRQLMIVSARPTQKSNA
jgi:hypothetical protein